MLTIFFIYLIGDIAFVFFEVLLVTLVLHKLLHYREKKEMLNKLNMVIGAFFSEVGRELLKIISDLDKNTDSISAKLIISNELFDKNFLEICKGAKKYNNNIEINKEELKYIRNFLKENMFAR